ADLRDIHHQPHASLADLRADGAAGGEHLPALADAIARERARALVLALHRFRTRLQDVEPAVLAVAPPFDVHRAPVMLLDGHRVAGELLHIRIVEREAV